jgi:SSS family solute:Na+ symporter
VDWAVVAGYAAAVVGLGALAGRRQRDTGDFFLGGRSLPWPLVGASILATAFSAASLLGGPGEAYQHGLLWLQLQVGDLLAILVVCGIFIPSFRGLELTTAYEYLERRFGAPARTAATLLFHLQVLFRTGVLLYGPALALATITGLDVRVAIVAVGAVAILYTLLGGITAVVWTDALQLVVIMVGVGLCAWVADRMLPDGLHGAMELASREARLRVVDLGQPAASVRSLAGAILGYGILSLSVAGTNQQPVQRYLSCRSVKAAQRAALMGWGVGFLVTLVTLLVGVLLFAFYRTYPQRLAAGTEADAIFPHFVAHELPAGAAGLLVAAIFAAAMSSLDSALNSLATASVVDVYRRFLVRDADERHYLRAARLLTLGWGLCGILAGLYVAGRGGLLAMAVRYVGYFAGPVLGLFLLGLLTRRTNGAGALLGAVVSFAVVVLMTNAERWFGTAAPVGGIWTAALGTAVCILVGAAASRLGPPPPPAALQGLVVSRFRAIH